MSRKSKKRDDLVVSAPGPMTVGDRTFLVGKPSKSDLIATRTWMRANYQRILNVQPGLGFTSADLAGLSPEDRRTFITEAAKHAKRDRELTADEAMDVATTPEGTAFMVWLAARRHDSTVTFDWLKGQITRENVEEVLAAFDDATGMDDDEGDADDPKAPGSASPSPTPTTGSTGRSCAAN